MNYQNFDVEDFITDERFIDWVKTDAKDLNEFWEAWLATHPEKKPIVEKAKDLIKRIDFQSPEPDQHKLDQILNKLQEDITEENVSRRLDRRMVIRFFRNVAAILVLGLLTWGIYDHFSVVTNNDYVTAFGEKEIIELPDGSKVHLNANSKIIVNEDWEKDKNREVWLEGEAYFEVSSKPKRGGRKFVVHAGAYDVAVLGTEFNVKNRNEHISVVLKSGKVNLSTTEDIDGDKKSMDMLPGEKISVDKGKPLQKVQVNPNVFISWVEDKILLDETSLGYLVEILEDNYGFQVEVSDQEMLKQTLSGSVIEENPEALINGIKAALQVKVEIKDKEITIGK